MKNNFNFKLISQDKNARLGKLNTAHGTIDTPIFMPVGNAATVKAMHLNDVEEGGETEFLHFSKRVKPKTGRIVIWPAGFPYVHRGNPPLSGEKYILTSWMMLR